MPNSIPTKKLIGAWLAFAAAAGALLAVSLPAAPTAAQASPAPSPVTTSSSTTTNIDLFPVERNIDQLGLKYMIIPELCDSSVTAMPAAQTEADGKFVQVAFNGKLAATDTTRHALDYRCGWKFHFCGVNGITPDYQGAEVIMGASVTLEKDVSANGQLNPSGRLGIPGPAMRNPATNQLESVFHPVGKLTLHSPDVLTSATGTGPDVNRKVACTRLVVQPIEGTTSATAAHVSYTFAPENCYYVLVSFNPKPDGSLYPNIRVRRNLLTSTHYSPRVPKDGQLDRQLDPVTQAEGIVVPGEPGKIYHQLPVDCDWNALFCHALVELHQTGDNSDLATAPNGSFQLNRSTEEVTIDSAFTGQKYTRIKDELRYLPADRVNKRVDELHFSNPSACTQDLALLAAPGSGGSGSSSGNDDQSASDGLNAADSAWQFHVTSRADITPAQITETFDLPASQRIFTWNTAAQRWNASASAARSATLSAGTTVAFRAAPPTANQLDLAGLTRTSETTLRQGWNIFTPALAAIGQTASDFTRVPGSASAAGASAAGASAVVFDPQLIDCASQAGVLVIYTYDQSDLQAQNGFRIALPCHPQVQAQSGIPAIESIDANDTIYAWFNSTTPVTLAFRNGRYTPS